MRTIQFFVASSVKEFEEERQRLGDFLLNLNGVFRARDVQLAWAKPEHMSIALSRRGSQEDFDQKVRESQFFFLLAGHNVGPYTEREFDAALDQNEKTGFPIIVPFFLSRGGDWPSESAVQFRNRLKELGYYPDRSTFKDMDGIKLALLMELEQSGLLNGETQEEIDEQEDADRALERIAERIRVNSARIDELKKQGLTWDGTIPQMVELYEENVRLVKKYHVEPEAVYWYADFLEGQYSLFEAIELLEWLEKLYAVDGAKPEQEARLAVLLGCCHSDCNHDRQAEEFFRKAYHIYRELSKRNPAKYEGSIAMCIGNLGDVLRVTNRTEEAESLFREALEMYRKLAKSNPGEYEQDIALQCNNLGVLMSNIAHLDDAEKYYCEALEIYRRLAKTNPDAYASNLAWTCNNLGRLYHNSRHMMKKAEQYYREALCVHRMMAETNPDANNPGLAWTCNDFADFLYNTGHSLEEAKSLAREAHRIFQGLKQSNPDAYSLGAAYSSETLADIAAKTGRREEAGELYKEALSVYDKYPYMNQDAKELRERLERDFPFL